MAQQAETLRELDRAFEQMSLPALSNVLHPDFAYWVTLPQSVNVPKRDRAQILEYYGKMFENWSSIATPVSTVLANTPGKIVAHVTGDVTLKSGSIVTYESTTTLEIADDASGNKKIKSVQEFIDANAQAQAFDPYATKTKA